MSNGRWVLIGVGLVASAAFAVAWWGQGRLVIDADDPSQVSRGAVVYQAQCAECHGHALEGQPHWQVRQPNGELPAPPHDASGHTWHHDDQYLFAVTKHGLARFAPPDYKSAMPSFVGKISDDDIRAVLAYIKASWPAEIRQRQEALNKR